MNESKLNLRLSKVLLTKARREAQRRGVGLSEWIRGLMADEVERRAREVSHPKPDKAG
jgi:predicted HicB family RNase H-like nuclease